MSGLEFARFLPGGGTEPGERLREAAVREIAEETGIDLTAQPLMHLAFAEGECEVGELRGPMRDEVFLARVPTSAVSIEGMEPAERDAFGGYRWWQVDALLETDEAIFPLGLASVLAAFRGAIDWPVPVRLDW